MEPSGPHAYSPSSLWAEVAEAALPSEGNQSSLQTLPFTQLTLPLWTGPGLWNPEAEGSVSTGLDRIAAAGPSLAQRKAWELKVCSVMVYDPNSRMSATPRRTFGSHKPPLSLYSVNNCRSLIHHDGLLAGLPSKWWMR